MYNVKELINILEPITWLLGDWQGKGTGGYPTHSGFEYTDNMHFKVVKEAFADEPLVHFEEIAKVRKENGEAFKHWETGYFIPAGNSRIKFLVCHNTGRVEVTLGKFEELDMHRKNFVISFKSISIKNDEGTKVALESRRELIFHEGIIKYRMEMLTSEVETLTNHLECKLERVQNN